MALAPHDGGDPVMRRQTDIAVVGGGAAGCAAALRACRQGWRVVVLDALRGRPSRFCGEFLSGEARHSLDSLGVTHRVEELGPPPIARLGLHGAGGGKFEMPLSAGGYGLSRRSLDAALRSAAEESGSEFHEGVRVQSVEGSAERGFSVRADGLEVQARAVIGAWGKRVGLDRTLGRRFLERPSPYIGVKLQYRRPPLEDAVRLYLFPGGHCGFVNVDGELGTLGILAREEALRAAGGKPENLIRSIRQANPALDRRIGLAEPIEDTLLTIAQIPLTAKESVAGDILLAGDGAGMTAPFLGLGVTNALAAGIGAADAAGTWLGGESDFSSAAHQYARQQHRRLGWVQRGSFAISWLLCRPGWGERALSLLELFPAAGRAIYHSSRPAPTPD